jgi:phage tail sheath protein FI
MSNYATPGVYVEEKSILPPSIVQVSTAVPVFLGYAAGGEIGKPIRITSLKEYEDHFKDPITGDFGNPYQFTFTGSDVAMPETEFFLYEALQLYFMNGGGDCYVIKVGDFSSSVDAAHFTASTGLPTVEKMDEPTLIVFPEAVKLLPSNYSSVVQAALTVCNNTMDKFTIIDAPNGMDLLDVSGELSTYRGVIVSDYLSYGAAYYPSLKTVIKVGVDESNFPGTPQVGSASYTSLKNAVNAVNRMIIPPSALMAGVYAKNDRDLGVWKAPANVPLQGVIKPTVQISDANQAHLNVDADSGKSINAIRQFAGKGTVVWGGRTLDGNSNEWRYINVRRLFMTVEESVKKATAQFVFENNDAKTWVKVSSMIKSYLNGLWKEGALTGASPEDAYFVNVGLGTTMTQQDVLEGRMIVKIGLAAVRPAEFIILEFSHFVNQ